MFKGKKILLGISGGIAAYKSIFLIRLLIKQGAEIKVVVTKNALQFVTKVTLETISKNKIYDNLFGDANDYSTEHIALTDWADIFIVAPATANIIGKLANGIADDALSTSLLAFNKPIYIAPAMNSKMYHNFAVVDNISYLMNNNIRFINPVVGDLACGYQGEGKMEEPENIISFIEADLKAMNIFKGKKVLVTAGPTNEAIDAVRFIGNSSSGIMGFAIAETFAEYGAEVNLVAGPVNLGINNPLIKRFDVITANEMYEKCMELYSDSDITIMSAAVADYTIQNPSTSKLKKSEKSMTLKLVPTKDILLELGIRKKKGQVLIGFALETNNEVKNAIKKLNTKNLDFIVLNSLNDQNAGFKYSTNKISIIDKNEKVTNFDLKTKKEVANDIINFIKEHYL